MGRAQTVKQLAKFLAYVLGRSPSEFGLVPDEHGYVGIRELLKSLSEEDGYRHVRRSHINEIVLTMPHPPVAISDDRIRAVDREHLRPPVTTDQLPKLLYTCVRRKAYPVVLQNGILPLGGKPHVVLTTDKSMALRIGRRFDPQPVLLTVQAAKCIRQGTRFDQSAENLFLAEFIASDCFTGPPLPKPEPLGKKPDKDRGPDHPPLPGSFILGPDFTPCKPSSRPYKKQKDADWKKERKHMKRRKRDDRAG